MTFITPSSKIWDFFYIFKVKNFGFWRNFAISAKGHFRGFHFYNTKYTKIIVMTPSTPKRTWCYFHFPLKIWGQFDTIWILFFIFVWNFSYLEQSLVHFECNALIRIVQKKFSSLNYRYFIWSNQSSMGSDRLRNSDLANHKTERVSHFLAISS